MLSRNPKFDEVYSLLPDDTDRPTAVSVPAESVPQPYRDLLVHHDHMTVTVESFYGGAVDVKVLACRHEGHSYARKILLAMQEGGRVVQFGLVRINLEACLEPVRLAILEGKTPLGRILIQNDMLRRIEPTAFLKVTLSEKLAEWFAARAGEETYGRLGVIYTGDRPVVEVLEILAPIR